MTEPLAQSMAFLDVRRRKIPTRWRYSVDAPLTFEVAISPPYAETKTFLFGRAPLAEALMNPGRHCAGASAHFTVRNVYTMEIEVFPSDHPRVMFYAAISAVTCVWQASLAMVPMCVARCCEDSDCAECSWLRRDIPLCSCGAANCPDVRPQ